jgi:hypothetical protein
MKSVPFAVVFPALLAVAPAVTRAHAEDVSLTLPVRALKVDGVPAVVLPEQGKLYVSCFCGANVSVFDARTRRQSKQVHLDAYETFTGPGGKREARLYPPGDLVAANGKLFVGQVFSDSLVVFDAATMWVVKRIPIEGEGSFAASPDGRAVYFASNRKNKFYIIDAESYQFRAVAYPDDGRGIGSVAVSPDGKRLYLGIQRGGQAPDGQEHSGGNCFLAAYDLTKRAYAGTVYLARLLPGGGSDDGIPRKMLFSADGRRLYVGMSQSLAGIYVIDPDRLRLERNIPFPANKGNLFAWADPIWLASYRGWLLCANRNNREVMVLDGSSCGVLARLTFAGDKRRCVTDVTVADGRIYLGDQEAKAIYELNGQKLARLLRGAAPQEKDGKPLEVRLQASDD